MATPQELAESKMDTNDHREKVGALMTAFANMLVTRAKNHDLSKLQEPELSAYAETIPKLKGLEYGTEEHRAVLRQMKPAIEHHYSVNSHHPECHQDGLDGMNLFDLVEMVCDWKAASARNPNADFNKSIDVNVDRFQMCNTLRHILKNTVEWLDSVDLS